MQTSLLNASQLQQTGSRPLPTVARNCVRQVHKQLTYEFIRHLSRLRLLAFDVPVRGCEHRTLGPLNVVQPRFFLSVLVSRLSHVCLWYCQQGEALHACALTHWLFSHQWLVVMCTATSFSPWFGEVLFEVSEPHTLAGIFQGSRVVRWCHMEVHRSRFESRGEVLLEVHHPPVLFLQRGYGVNRSFFCCSWVLQVVPQVCW